MVEVEMVVMRVVMLLHCGFPLGRVRSVDCFGVRIERNGRMRLQN